MNEQELKRFAEGVFMDIKPKWRKIFDIEYPNYSGGRLSVYKDWISYQDIGFNPKTSYELALKKAEDKVEAIKLGYEKWEKEFNK